VRGDCAAAGRAAERYEKLLSHVSAMCGCDAVVKSSAVGAVIEPPIEIKNNRQSNRFSSVVASNRSRWRFDAWYTVRTRSWLN
jgi:hypothetical protein